MLALKKMEELLHNVEQLIQEDQNSFAGIFPYDQPAGTFKVLSGSGTSLSLEVLKRAVDRSKAAWTQRQCHGACHHAQDHAMCEDVSG
jgi:hypothetical protein